MLLFSSKISLIKYLVPLIFFDNSTRFENICLNKKIFLITIGISSGTKNLQRYVEPIATVGIFLETGYFKCFV